MHAGLMERRRRAVWSANHNCHLQLSGGGGEMSRRPPSYMHRYDVATTKPLGCKLICFLFATPQYFLGVESKRNTKREGQKHDYICSLHVYIYDFISLPFSLRPQDQKA